MMRGMSDLERTLQHAPTERASSAETPTIDLPEGRPEASEFTRRYQERRLLGEGGMGSVLLCADAQIGRHVALKIIRAAPRAGARAERRFLREARVQGQLEHPALVPVYDLGITPDGAVYFTMKRVRGETLEDVLRELRGDPRFTRRKLLAAFARVCLAVDFAHRRGVLHRDLKPANVMLGDFGEVYVLDWWLAKLTDHPDLEPEPDERVAVLVTSETAPGAVLGTPSASSRASATPSSGARWRRRTRRARSTRSGASRRARAASTSGVRPCARSAARSRSIPTTPSPARWWWAASATRCARRRSGSTSTRGTCARSSPRPARPATDPTHARQTVRPPA